MSEFDKYIEHGWALTEIQPGQKGPRLRGWNQRDKTITTPGVIGFASAGLCHAYSGTCAIDVDNFEVAEAWLAERGVDLVELFNADDSVQILSGRSNHGKLLYALPEPMQSKTVARFKDPEDPKKLKAALDFRCATAAGLTVQDVLPPSIHPDTGRPYQWQYGDSLIGDWRTLPELPARLLEIWTEELEDRESRDAVPSRTSSLGELQQLLAHQDPDMNMQDWVKVGMAIHHETGGSDEGLALWDEWSRRSDKYTGDTFTRWRSFHDTANAVTVGYLRQGSVASVDEFDDVSADVPDEDDPWLAAEAELQARFSLTQVGTIAKRDPPEWLVDRLIPKADLAMMYGEPGAGKSFVGLDLAFALATGTPFFDLDTVQCPVVWVAAEAAGEMRNRTKAYAQVKGLELSEIPLYVVEQPLTLMNKDEAKALRQVIAPAQPGLIIVDTLAAASGGANENSGEDMNSVLSECRVLHDETGALVLLIHHSGKDATRGARGWSGIKAAMHTEIMLRNPENTPLRFMSSTKQRSASTGDEFAFKLKTVPLGFEDAESCVVEKCDVIKQTKKAMTDEMRRVLGVIERVMWQEGEKRDAVDSQVIYDEYMLATPPPPDGRTDNRDTQCQRILTRLVDQGYLRVSDDNMISIAGVSEDMFDELEEDDDGSDLIP